MVDARKFSIAKKIMKSEDREKVNEVQIGIDNVESEDEDENNETP